MKVSPPSRTKQDSYTVDEMANSTNITTRNDNPAATILAHNFSLEMTRLIRHQVMREILQACDGDAEKIRIVRELTEKVMNREATPLGATTTVPLSGQDTPVRDEQEVGSEDDNDKEEEDDDGEKLKLDMDEIEDSPYETESNAEAGEVIFETMKALLVPEKTPPSRRRTGGDQTPTKKSFETLGSERARAMVTAHFHIANSGMLYSPSWLQGKIQDMHVMGLTAPMILLCLQDIRFSRPDIKGVMTKLVEDLRVASIVREALDDWDLENQFPKLAACQDTPFPYYRSHRTNAQKCELFVARAFACMNFLHRKTIKGTIASKVLTCLQIMEQQLEVDARSAKGPDLPTHTQAPNTSLKACTSDQGSLPSRAGGGPPHQRKAGSHKTTQGISSRGRKPHVTVMVVEQLDLQTGRVLASYPSCYGAARMLGLKYKGSISEMLRGRNKSAGGFFWRKVGSRNLPEGVVEDKSSSPDSSLPNKNPMVVEQLDLNTGRVLASYPSYAGAAKMLGLKHHGGISDTIRGHGKSAYGFFWRKVGSKNLPEGVVEDVACLPSADCHMRPNTKLQKQTTPSSCPRKRPREKPAEALDVPSKKRRQERGALFEANKDENGCENDIPTGPANGQASMRKILAMKDIVDSPYQESATAEVGEEMFETFLSLLIPRPGFGRKKTGASDPAIKNFGNSLAQKIVDASSKIALSGIVYSTEWSEGVFRDENVGSIPKPVLLLLLQEHRFSQRGVLDALTIVVVEFELCRVMTKALLQWKLADRFSKISQVTVHSVFTTKQLQCYQCLIFIGRVYHCMRLLNLKTMTESIRRKVESCLQILEANVGHRPPRGPDARGVANPKDKATIARDDESSVDDTLQDSSSPPKDITKTSHVLFQQATATVRITNTAQLPGALLKPLGDLSAGKCFPHADAPMPTSVATKMASKVALPSPISQEHSQGSSGESNEDHWFPCDSKKEFVLTPSEVEIGWLVEESIYCLRSREINWRFVYSYASPTLRIELRKHSVNQLEKFVRLQDNSVSERFQQLRREVRRTLHSGSTRERMKDTIPKERVASRQVKTNNPAVPQQGSGLIRQQPQKDMESRYA